MYVLLNLYLSKTFNVNLHSYKVGKVSMKQELCDQLYVCPITSMEILERIIDDTKASDFEENVGGSIKARSTCQAAGKLKKLA